MEDLIIMIHVTVCFQQMVWRVNEVFVREQDNSVERFPQTALTSLHASSIRETSTVY